jgi:hypothetical protein
MHRLILHVYAQFRIARINNTFLGAVRDMLRKPSF